MKHAAMFALALLAALSAFGGVTYDFHTEVSGLQQMTMDGTVAVDGPNLRMTMATGDGMLFKSGATLYSRDGGKSLAVYDPDAKTYYEIGMDDITSTISGMLSNPSMKVSFVNPTVTVKDGGDGGTIEGLPAHKSLLDSSIDLNIEAMGQTITSRMSMHSESWTTDKLGPIAANIFQQRNALTGIEALDKLVEAQSASLKGRFPLKQVTKVTVSMNGRDITTTTTATVSNIKQKALDATFFAAPQGYSRVDNPLAAMKKAAN